MHTVKILWSNKQSNRIGYEPFMSTVYNVHVNIVCADNNEFAM